MVRGTKSQDASENLHFLVTNLNETLITWGTFGEGCQSDPWSLVGVGGLDKNLHPSHSCAPNLPLFIYISLHFILL